MAAGGGYVPDWRDRAAYKPLLEADRSLFAWEWLRRNRGYRAAAEQALETGGRRGPGDADRTAERWGLHRFERPSLAAPDARPIWSAGVHPCVLTVDARPAEDGEAFDLQRLAALSTLVTAVDGREHLLISDGLRAIRIDVIRGSLKHGPVHLHYRIEGLAGAEAPVLALRRFLALCRTGRFSGGLHPAGMRAGRHILLLRAHDALMSGAAQREIAAGLLSAEAGNDRWRVTAPSVRSRAQRLARGARAMASGGYLALLSGDPGSSKAG